jgi:hypothetical protein
LGLKRGDAAVDVESFEIQENYARIQLDANRRGIVLYVPLLFRTSPERRFRVEPESGAPPPQRFVERWRGEGWRVEVFEVTPERKVPRRKLGRGREADMRRRSSARHR